MEVQHILIQDKERWMARINVLYSIRDKPNLILDCKLHSRSLDLQAWLSSQSNYTLCFDGASKRNPREVGAGWFSLNLEEIN
jgi:hypothetical protein